MGRKRYWLEVLVFGIVAAGLILCTAPAPTWINTDSDGIHDLYAATNGYLSHKTSMPLYLIVGNLFTHIPIGDPFWRLAMFSALATIGACVFIYLSIRHHLKESTDVRLHKHIDKWIRVHSLLGVLLYGGSMLVISQSTIVETYALVSMLGMAAYYFYIKGMWKTTALMLGLGLSVHLLAGIPVLVMYVANKNLRKWKPIAITLSCLLLYAYIPLSSMIHPEQPNMWANKSLSAMFDEIWRTYNMLFGSLAIYDLPKRLLDTGAILLASLGLAVIPILWYLRKTGKKSVLLWLFVLPIIMFIIGLPPQTHVYAIPSIAIGAVMASVGLSKVKPIWLYSTGFIAIALFTINAWYMDIGRTLDPNLSANQYYTVELAKVPDGQILMPQYGWEWAAIYPYNKEFGRNIVPVSMDTLVAENYQSWLTDHGIKFNPNEDIEDRQKRADAISLSIVNLNENVWTTKTTDAKTYGCEVLKATGNEYLFDHTPAVAPGQIHWRPSNPYLFVTGQLEIKEWGNITLSNWNVMFFGGLASLGLILNWLLFIMPAKRKEREHIEVIGADAPKT